MLNYLMDLNITPEDIKLINDSLSKNTLTSLELSRSVVIETLNYYKSLGIKDLTNIIVKRPDLVLIKKEDIEQSISKVNKELIINIFNNDIDDLILFGI